MRARRIWRALIRSGSGFIRSSTSRVAGVDLLGVHRENAGETFAPDYIHKPFRAVHRYRVPGISRRTNSTAMIQLEPASLVSSGISQKS
jgi:hypothetical protein